ncbi:MAG: transposase [Rhizobiales bacterium]|nr:transposase [Hyphomicrobiales bacterium]
MPYKFKADYQDKFDQKRYRVINWPAYNESLRQRGDITVWLSADVADAWFTPKRTSPGGQGIYSELAIMTCLTLGMLYNQALRQTVGLMRGLVRLMALDVPVPCFSTLSRRSSGLKLPIKFKFLKDVPIHLVVDSTGLSLEFLIYSVCQLEC